jgi:FAD/FMN-containing dehydrogenase
MDRREFLRRSGLAALGASLLPAAAACSSGSSSPSPTPSTFTPTSSATTSSPTPSPISETEWRSFGGSLDGTLYLPSSQGYAVATQLYDPRFDGSHPQAVVRCTSPTDVQRSIGFARTHGIPIAPRCGGHSYGGYSTGPGMVIDVSGMSAVALGTGTAHVGAGTRLADLYASVGPAGVAIPGGTCPTVGIAGLTLGGGQGVIGRRFGLTCDRLTELDVVTSDGVLRHCSAHEEPDLFWASRGGGGGNFGIATSFTFATAPIGQVVMFSLAWPWAAAADVVGGWQTWGPTAPDELWSDCHLIYKQGQGPTVSVNGVFIGPASGLTPQLAALRSAVGAAPSSSSATPMSYFSAMTAEAACVGLTQAQCHLPSQNPAGTLRREESLATSDFYDAAVPAAGVKAMVHAVAARGADAVLRRGEGGILLDAFGGAINRVPARATAFAHRSSKFLAQSFVTLPDRAPSSVVAKNQTWLDTFWSAMRPWASGQAYQNYIDPKLKDWETAYYGENLQRLVQVKNEYDPDDVFHFAQSIPTSLS